MRCRTNRRIALTSIVTCLVLLASTIPAGATPSGMDSRPLPGLGYVDTSPGFSPTNPQYPQGPFMNTALTLPHPDDSGPGYEMSWWRNGWGNNPFPLFNLHRVPATHTAHVLGMIYTVNRMPDTQIETATPENYYQLGANLQDTSMFTPLFLDIVEIQAAVPPTLPAEDIVEIQAAEMPTLPAEATFSHEGRWYLHYRWYDSSRYGTPTVSIPFGIDVTPPRSPETLTAIPHARYTGRSGSDVWFNSQRANIRWSDVEYDQLSGTALYEFTVNGKLHPTRLFHLAHVATNLTLESDVIRPGRNRIEVVAVDRATNRSAPQVVYFNSDTDTPTISVSAPRANALVPAVSTFSVVASDAAGIRDVRFHIDGRLVHTDTSAPYSASLNLSAFPNGTRTFSATVTDMFGRQVTRQVPFVLDRTPPAISGFSFSPSLFYPIIRDGIRDNMTVRATISERANVQLLVYSSTGAVWATRSANFPAGALSIAWNGRGPNNSAPVPGRYTFRLRVQDPAGNVTWGAVHRVEIRNFELIRVGPNAVRVVPR